MTPKLSKEEERARKAAIDSAIALGGKKVYDYRGEPASHRSWRQQQAKRRLGNHIKAERDTGRGADSAGARHVAKEGT